MMYAVLKPFRARGDVNAPAAKSAAHRLLILAALGDRPCTVLLDSVNEDIAATLSCLRALGCEWTREGDVFTVPPIVKRGGAPLLDCGESGSTLRFLLPVALGLGGAEMTGRGRLPLRPMDELLLALEKEGAVFSQRRLPLKAGGTFDGGEFTLPGNVSSQYLTGLMLASPLARRDTVIRLTTPLESAAYVDMTLDALRLFGITVERGEDWFRVPGGQRVRTPGAPVRTEGDWSGAAFPLCLGALGGDVTVTGLDPASRQGDRAILGILKEMGAETETETETEKETEKEAGKGTGSVRVRSAGALRAAEIDVSGIPDLVPPLAAVMMHARGTSRLYNAARLRLKESDRLASARDMVNSLGGDAAIEGDSLVIRGRERVRGGSADGAGDHRIVMAAAVAASACAEESRVSSPGALNKSYPAFPDHIRRLGGIFDVIDVR